jgi:hypothetical protein
MDFASIVASAPALGFNGPPTAHGVLMVDKHRQRRVPAPRGGLPGWALMAFFVCSAVAIGLARVLA